MNIDRKRISKSLKPTHYIILLFVLTIPFVNLNHHKWKGKEGVIVWDIKSYYAYLPAAFIYQDMSLDFIEKNPEKNLSQWIWPVTTPTGKKAIITSSGLSMMYAPFFFISHGYAHIDKDYEPDGYSRPYQVGLVFSAFFYFILALFALRKILLKYVNEKAAAFSLFAVGAGTNLFYYVTYEAAMSHSYNFFLIVLFTLIVIHFHEKTNLKNSIILGLLSGLIVLIRPTNIIILLLIPLYGINNYKTLKNNFRMLLKKWYLILIIGICFILVWIPQFAYWYYVSGKIFYFSYAETGGKFFFNNPQITDFLFSFKKGWYVYTPLMLIATYGIFLLFKIKNELAIPILVIFILQIYTLSSWWSWWFGGAFGQRSMIDIYGLLAIPMAIVIVKERMKLISKIAFFILISTLIFFNQFQTQQYRRGAIHYWWMNKEAYFETFLKLNPTCKYWRIILIPDYEKAREGIYVSIPVREKNSEISDSLLKSEIISELIKNDDTLNKSYDSKNDTILSSKADQIINSHQAGKYFKNLKLKFYKNYINNCESWKKEVKKKAKRNKISYEMALSREADRVYEKYSEKYEDTFN